MSANGLSPQQKRFVNKHPALIAAKARTARFYLAILKGDIERATLIKISALQELAYLLGMISARRQFQPSREERNKSLKKSGGLDFGLQIINQLRSPTASNSNRAACAILLKIFIPHWQSIASEELIGCGASREDKLVREWRKQVLDRDRCRCLRCNKADNLNAHHIVRWVDAPALRVSLSNGETLCANCHLEAHGGRFNKP